MGKDLKGKELGQGIVQKKSGRYEARYVDRFGKRISISGKDFRDVKKRYNEALYENDKQINIRESVTLDEWYKEWMNVYKFDVIRENTKKYYNTVYKKHISPYLGMFNLADITQYQIKKRLKELKENGYKFETCNKVKILLVGKKFPAPGITLTDPASCRPAGSSWGRPGTTSRAPAPWRKDGRRFAVLGITLTPVRVLWPRGGKAWGERGTTLMGRVP